MTIKQLSIFIENKSGTLIKVLDLLSKESIQIIAPTIADTTEFGIYRVICNEPTKAYNILKDNNINVQLTDVLGIRIKDKPGMAAQAIDLISKAGIDISYMYTFLLNGEGILIMRTNPCDKTKEIIKQNNIGFITENDLQK